VTREDTTGKRGSQFQNRGGGGGTFITGRGRMALPIACMATSVLRRRLEVDSVTDTMGRRGKWRGKVVGKREATFITGQDVSANHLHEETHPTK